MLAEPRLAQRLDGISLPCFRPLAGQRRTWLGHRLSDGLLGQQLGRTPMPLGCLFDS